MNEFIHHLFGTSNSIDIWQMAARAGLMFFITLAFVRISGRRSLGLRTPFDIIITLLLGATLARGIIGGVPFWSVCTAGLVLVTAHRLVAWIAIRSKWVARLLHGKPILLYENGKMLHRNLLRALVSERELKQHLVLHAAGGDLTIIESAWLETNGEIGVILKKGEAKNGEA